MLNIMSADVTVSVIFQKYGKKNVLYKIYKIEMLIFRTVQNCDKLNVKFKIELQQPNLTMYHN